MIAQVMALSILIEEVFDSLTTPGFDTPGLLDQVNFKVAMKESFLLDYLEMKLMPLH